MERKLLRKLEYPACAKECLLKIENFIVNRNKVDLAMDLISEFIFCEKSEKGLHSMETPSLNLIQEFQLIVVLSEFFSIPGPDVTRNAIFLSLFGGTISMGRINVLVKLISTSVSCSISHLLCAAGAWMQQIGCTSASSLNLAEHLVTDFIIFSRKSSDHLKQLPMVAPRFSANFMTAVAELYLNENKSNQLRTPPDMLLDIFTEWVSDNPSLCLASQEPLALPPGAIVMPVDTPLAGLIRWCVLAPFSENRTHPSYSKLHLAILQSLQKIPTTTIIGPSTALNAQSLYSIINLLQVRKDMLRQTGIEAEADNLHMQQGLERFAQAIQVALASRCIYRNIPQLLGRLETLPSNMLLQLVIKSNKSSL